VVQHAGSGTVEPGGGIVGGVRGDAGDSGGSHSASTMKQDSPDQSIHATSAPGSFIHLTIDKAIGKQFLIIIWLSAFVASLAVLVMLVLWDAHRITRQHVKILEYDLMDLRSKTGNSHENTE